MSDTEEEEFYSRTVKITVVGESSTGKVSSIHSIVQSMSILISRFKNRMYRMQVVNLPFVLDQLVSSIFRIVWYWYTRGYTRCRNISRTMFGIETYGSDTPL